MDQIYEDEILAEEEPKAWFNPISYVLSFLAQWGWFLVLGGAAVGVVSHRALQVYRRRLQAKEDAQHHKDDGEDPRMEALRRARERQQSLLETQSQRQREIDEQRQEQKRLEKLERLKKYGAATEGRRLGAADDDGYLPLSGGASTSSYRPPKKSKCPGGGCGR
ncbi:uncharacterized protein LOC126378997 [Pectinophora gossypiella]|uniref:uncharacterized protein LOC126378997 n=1 Tax=Pectinophora gossypiella TaxID=13191 RepID=UPI00214F55FA|nr:uncharacterized protein LOC126378997 [Pectinophora gossypiella]